MPATKSPGIIAVECQVETLVRNGKNMKNHALFGDHAQGNQESPPSRNTQVNPYLSQYSHSSLLSSPFHIVALHKFN